MDAAGTYDRRVRIEQKNVTRDPNYGSEVVAWATLATVWASVADQLQAGRGGGEAVEAGVRVATVPVRLCIRYRSDITTDMRVQLLDRGRVLQIVSVAEVGRRDGTELMCEGYTV